MEQNWKFLELSTKLIVDFEFLSVSLFGLAHESFSSNGVSLLVIVVTCTFFTGVP